MLIIQVQENMEWIFLLGIGLKKSWNVRLRWMAYCSVLSGNCWA